MTRIWLLFAVPPEKPKIFDERSQEVRLKLGPYRIGDTVTLKCTAYGGNANTSLMTPLIGNGYF